MLVSKFVSEPSSVGYPEMRWREFCIVIHGINKE
jgi:hypothetical protein